MLKFLSQNIGTIVVSVILTLIVAFVIIRMIKNKKAGKSSCGCGCANCAMANECHKKN